MTGILDYETERRIRDDEKENDRIKCREANFGPWCEGPPKKCSDFEKCLEDVAGGQ